MLLKNKTYRSAILFLVSATVAVNERESSVPCVLHDDDNALLGGAQVGGMQEISSPLVLQELEVPNSLGLVRR